MSPAPETVMPGTRAKSDPWRFGLAVALAFALWLLVTRVFFIGYVGTDDFFYSRYAFLFHRQPINWWECRLPAVLAIRAAFALFGPTEIAAALPTLLCSVLSIAAIAWYVDWPRQMTWRNTASVILAITLPLDVTFRSVPGAVFDAAGLLVAGSAAILKGGTRMRIAGSVCFGLALATHEVSLFYIGIFSLTAAVIDRRKYFAPLIVSGACCAAAIGAQCAYYAISFGNPWLRFRIAASESAVAGLIDPDLHITGLAFLFWPIKTLLFSKVFGFSLLCLFAAGVLVRRKLKTEERILLASAILTWFYLGFGSKTVLSYHPLARMYHFYGPLILGISVLTPICLEHLFRKSPRARQWSIASVCAIVIVNLACCAGGGKWGQNVRTSSVLLAYASQHPGQRLLCDVATLNEMYVVNGFKLPANVFTLNGAALEHLLVNKEPAGHGAIAAFPQAPLDGILINDDRALDDAGDRDVIEYIHGHPGTRARVAEKKLKPVFVPFASLLKDGSFAVLSEGAEVLYPDGRNDARMRDSAAR